MLQLLLIALTVSHVASMAVNSTGSIDEQGICQCSVILPDTTFPADRMEILERENAKLSISIQQEITKIQSYRFTLTGYLDKLTNLTKRVEVMENGASTYKELDFELLKLEIKEMESVVEQLKVSISGSNNLVETLYEEIKNISVMVNQLESHDKNNVLAVRREIDSLRKRLEEYEKNQNSLVPSPVDYGTCNHGGIMNISKPFVVQQNWMGYSYKYGGWGRDSYLGANQSVYWVAPMNSELMTTLRFHQTYEDLLLNKRPTDKNLATYGYNAYGTGGGMIMYNNSMYYNCYYSRDLCKFNIETNTLQRKTLTDAYYSNQLSYSSSPYQDIDMASDEEGLWVIYSSEQNAGNIVISKLNTSLGVEKTWLTNQYKRGVTNSFMVCGVLYATRSINTKREEIFYMYDTKTGNEGQLSIQLDKIMDSIQSLSYNPNDHKLYMYNDAFLVSYDLIFKKL
ncbi:olfactomedin-4-like [Rhinophrynus dorsalis]